MFCFAALLGLLAAGLRTIAVQKARTQGNEVATMAMEDLQRFSFNNLLECNPPANPPAGFASSVLGNCSASPLPYEQPGDGTAGCPNTMPVTSSPVMKETYTCNRLNLTYTVRRYIAWADPGQTTKRLAVFVDWTDRVGQHEVSQQSSLRAPDRDAIIGLSPPAITAANATVSCTANCVPAGTSGVMITGNQGTMMTGNSISLTATTQNMAVGDDVFVTLRTLDSSGNPQSSPIQLTSSDGNSWTATMTPTAPSAFTYDAGQQFVTVTAERAGDGKSAGALAQVNGTSGANLSFCPSGSACSMSWLPNFMANQTSITSSSGTFALQPNGGLPGDLTVTAQTQNLTPSDTVTVSFPTQGGSIAVSLTEDPTLPQNSACTTSSSTPVCVWSGKILQSSGYKFVAGSTPFYLIGQQIISSSGGSVDKGSTGAAIYTVTFS